MTTDHGVVLASEVKIGGVPFFRELLDSSSDPSRPGRPCSAAGANGGGSPGRR